MLLIAKQPIFHLERETLDTHEAQGDRTARICDVVLAQHPTESFSRDGFTGLM